MEHPMLNLKDKKNNCYFMQKIFVYPVWTEFFTFFRIRHQGSYRQVSVKLKDFSRTSKRFFYCFQGLKTYENNVFHIKILLLKC